MKNKDNKSAGVIILHLIHLVKILQHMETGRSG